jgi:hypothetical protein
MLRQEDYEFKARLGYIGDPVSKNQNNKMKIIQVNMQYKKESSNYINVEYELPHSTPSNNCLC